MVERGAEGLGGHVSMVDGASRSPELHERALARTPSKGREELGSGAPQRSTAAPYERNLMPRELILD